METEDGHARAVARRVLALRFAGLILLLLVLAIEGAHGGRRYVALCAGCALVQLAHLDFPKAAKDVGAARISVIELMHPQMYWGLSLCTGVLALASFALELWTGFYLYRWKTVLFTLVGTTVAVDFLATRVLWAISGAVGVVITLIAVAIVFAGG
jgi:hypothetical protein